jgi:hypothetical protein
MIETIVLRLQADGGVEVLKHVPDRPAWSSADCALLGRMGMTGLYMKRVDRLVALVASAFTLVGALADQGGESPYPGVRPCRRDRQEGGCRTITELTRPE